MMLSKLLGSEWMKIKRKGLWFLTLLGPLGVIGLTMVNYGVRKDYLLAQSEDDWAYYLDNVAALTPMALVLGIVILTSLLASIEAQTNAWKMWLALPVRRGSVYLSKYLIAAVLLLVSSCILAVGTAVYGMTLGLGDDIPWLSILEYSFYPWVASQALIALHLWCALTSSNQGFTVSLGIVGVIAVIIPVYLPDWVIWKWPSLVSELDNPWSSGVIGVGAGLLLFMAGMLHFSRKDVG
ncbi:multidrug ABC transporter permease [Paenibacillus montaniterrae]|uniref:Multidrug ABC transporter permease n=2 Tax=Paenibacillus montaniterrae TaxID=429341 RepID=A0A919YSM7_9BACL|nr:multidrug ABC transporter permease [Paenibacillus montaniterrae]